MFVHVTNNHDGGLRHGTLIVGFDVDLIGEHPDGSHPHPPAPSPIKGEGEQELRV